MIQALLSMLREAEMLDAVPSLIHMLENITGSLVKVTQAENGTLCLTTNGCKHAFIENSQRFTVSPVGLPLSAAAEPA